jgi:hypothetical protein
MVGAIHEVVSTTEGSKLGTKAVGDVAIIVTSRMKDLERALGLAKKSGLRAADRLALERTVTAIARDLGGALDLVELLSEASATGSVPVDVTDVIRESAVRSDQAAGRSRRLSVTFVATETPVIARVNPRLAMRLFAFGAALAAGKSRAVHTIIRATDENCILHIAPATAPDSPVVVAAPRLIAPSEDCVASVAEAAEARFERKEGEVTLTFPRAHPE